MKNIELKWRKPALFVLLVAGIFPVSCTKDKISPTPKKPVIKFHKYTDPVIPGNHIDTSIYIKAVFPGENQFTNNRSVVDSRF